MRPVHRLGWQNFVPQLRLSHPFQMHPAMGPLLHRQSLPQLCFRQSHLPAEQHPFHHWPAQLHRQGPFRRLAPRPSARMFAAHHLQRVWF